MWITSSLSSQLMIFEASCVGGWTPPYITAVFLTFQQQQLPVFRESQKEREVTLFVRMLKFWLTAKSNGFVLMHISLQRIQNYQLHIQTFWMCLH